jgi:adenylylsulfate kinase-like enzyme
MPATRLVVISGPIASGKSSTAQELAVRARAKGRGAAVVDLDRVYLMLDDGPAMREASRSRQARRAAAALANQFLSEGIELVVVEGDFWSADARADFVARLTSAAPVFVTLGVSEKRCGE